MNLQNDVTVPNFLDKSNPNLLGEYFRKEFFEESYFNLIPKKELEVWEDLVKEDNCSFVIFSSVKRFGDMYVSAFWYWNKDWILEFDLENEDRKNLHTSNIKNNESWEYV